MVYLRKFRMADAVKCIESFNRDYIYAATDSLTARHFRSYQVLPTDEAAYAVALIDGLWATGLRYVPGAGEIMLRLYEKHKDVCQRKLEELKAVRLADDPERVFDLASSMLEAFVGESVSGPKQYSFASKFFHWHAPQHLPIVDSNARRAIRALQEESSAYDNMIRKDTSLARGTPIRDYWRWVLFYSDLIRELSERGQDRVLLEADRRSLAGEFRLENTLLRVLDKVFYVRGSRSRSAAR